MTSISSNPGSTNSNSSGPAVPYPPVTESFQPTVRVMRLYKPGMHSTSTFPKLPNSISQEYDELQSTKSVAVEMSLTPYLLLPDSFGDIYFGEKFSAYIGVVNGYQNLTFYQVSLAVRLQTSSTVFDLYDIRQPPNSPIAVHQCKALNFNENTDIIVQQYLNELGTHTLRVTVQYLVSLNSEPKTIRKFYRFNVLQPLTVFSNFMDVGGKPMVQCQVTNNTKGLIFIDEMNFIPFNRFSTWEKLVVGVDPILLDLRGDEKDSDEIVTDDIKSSLEFMNSEIIITLQPDESYAFSFYCTRHDSNIGKVVGHPEVRWCATMGEYSICKGEETLLRVTAPQPPSVPIADPVSPSAISTPLYSSEKMLPSTYYSSTVSNRSELAPSTVTTAMAPNVITSQVPPALKVQCISYPHEARLGEEFGLILRVTNATAQPIIAQLRCTNHFLNPEILTAEPLTFTRSGLPLTGNGSRQFLNSSGLCVTGLSFTTLGLVESTEYIDYPIRVFAISRGLHDLIGITVIDASNNREYPTVGSLAKIMIREEHELLSDDINALVVTDPSNEVLRIDEDQLIESI